MISFMSFAETGSTALTGAATAGVAIIMIAAELASAGQSELLVRLRRHLVAYAVPLLIVFASVVAVALVEFMSG